MKTHATFSVDEGTFIGFRSRVPNRDRSRVIEQFMRSYAIITESDREEEEIEKAIEECRLKLEETRVQLSEYVAELSLKRANRMKNEVIRRKELESMYDSVRAVNPLRD